MKREIILFAMFLAAACGGGLLAHSIKYRATPEAAALDCKMSQGMNREEAEMACGKPAKIMTTEDHGVCWIYPEADANPPFDNWVCFKDNKVNEFLKKPPMPSVEKAPEY